VIVVIGCCPILAWPQECYCTYMVHFGVCPLSAPSRDDDANGHWSERRPAAHRESERLREPQPLVRRRIASGRGATEQPNAKGDGDAALTPRFWLMFGGSPVSRPASSAIC